MKKTLKGLCAVAFAFVLLLGLTGCGEEKTNNGGGNTNQNNNGEYQGSTDGANDLKNVTEKNYKAIAKSIFGVEIKDVSGWTLKEATSINKVNNFTIEYTVSNGETAKTVIEYYFNKCKSVSSDGIYSQGFGENYTVVKKTKYDDFESFYTAEATIIDPLYQGSWIYDNNGKSIQFIISINSTKADITFTLLG